MLQPADTQAAASQHDPTSSAEQSPSSRAHLDAEAPGHWIGGSPPYFHGNQAVEPAGETAARTADSHDCKSGPVSTYGNPEDGVLASDDAWSNDLPAQATAAAADAKIRAWPEHWTKPDEFWHVQQQQQQQQQQQPSSWQDHGHQQQEQWSRSWSGQHQNVDRGESPEAAADARDAPESPAAQQFLRKTSRRQTLWRLPDYSLVKPKTVCHLEPQFKASALAGCASADCCTFG